MSLLKFLLIIIIIIVLIAFILYKMLLSTFHNLTDKKIIAEFDVIKINGGLLIGYEDKIYKANSPEFSVRYDLLVWSKWLQAAGLKPLYRLTRIGQNQFVEFNKIDKFIYKYGYKLKLFNVHGSTFSNYSGRYQVLNVHDGLILNKIE